MTRPALALSTSEPARRGQMMDAREIARDLFFGKVSARWVRDNVPGKMRFGQSTVLWYREDVEAFIDRTREGVA